MALERGGAFFAVFSYSKLSFCYSDISLDLLSLLKFQNFKILILIYLAAPGLRCGMWDLVL